MKEAIAKLEDEVEFLNVVIERYARGLSNQSMAFFGTKKEILMETIAQLNEDLARIEAEAMKEMHKKAQEKAAAKLRNPNTGKGKKPFTTENQPQKNKPISQEVREQITDDMIKKQVEDES